jgi:hypothetical protein
MNRSPPKEIMPLWDLPPLRDTRDKNSGIYPHSQGKNDFLVKTLSYRRKNPYAMWGVGAYIQSVELNRTIFAIFHNLSCGF